MQALHDPAPEGQSHSQERKDFEFEGFGVPPPPDHWPGHDEVNHQAPSSPMKVSAPPRTPSQIYLGVGGDNDDHSAVDRNDKLMHAISFPLHKAALTNDVSLAQTLLALPTTDVNQRDESGCTALSVAVYEGHLDLVVLLLAEQSVDVNLTNAEGYAPLHRAPFAKQGMSQGIVKALLAASRVDVNVRNKSGQTTLAMALRLPEIVSVLLAAKGIDVNPVDSYGCTPMLLAAKSGRADAVDALLKAPHIDVNKENANDGQSPLYVAVAGAHTEVVAALLAVPGVNVNLPDNHGCSSLHLAAREGHTQIVVLLSARDIDVNQANVNGLTPLHAAAREGHGAVVDTLLAMPGIDATVVDAMLGQTPLEMATEHGYDAIADALQAAMDQTDAPSTTETVEEFSVLRELLAGGLHNSVLSASLKRAKLLFVGRGRSGKSSTLEALKKGRAFDNRERSTAAARQDTLAVFAQEDVQAQEWTAYKPIGQERQRVRFLCTL